MARTNRLIDATTDDVESAKQTAVSLLSDVSTQGALDLFYTDNLEEVETGIKKINNFSDKSWLLSAILLYTLIYNNFLYKQSGLDWAEYSKQARERLGLDPRDVTEQLSSARFFIKNHAALERAGFITEGNFRKLARAELATDLCGDVNLVIQHLVKDTWREYKDWYSSFKLKKAIISKDEYKRQDLQIIDNKFIIGSVEAVKISDDIPEEDKTRLQGYIKQIFEAIQQGYEPAIVPVYNKQEADLMPKLRDKYRQGK